MLALDQAHTDFITKDGNKGLFWHLKERIDHCCPRQVGLEATPRHVGWWRNLRPDPLDCFQIWSARRAEQAFLRFPAILIDKDEHHTKDLWMSRNKPFIHVPCSGEKSDLAVETREGLRADAEANFKTIVDPRVVDWSASAGVELAGMHRDTFWAELEAGCTSEEIHQVNIK